MSRYRFKQKWSTILVLSIIFYNEWFSYVFNSIFWSKLPVDQPENSVTLLIISDPQIIGYRQEPSFPLGLITRWDADKYIRRNFLLALRHVEPDVVVFLGDLMDEGSIANDDEFQIYLKRFRDIFAMPSSIKAVFIPGDNDIGGEGFDRLSFKKHERFRETFHEDQHVMVKFVSFLRVNVLSETLEESSELDSKHKNSDHITILLSHMPILTRYIGFAKEAVEAKHPALILSGHHHRSALITSESQGLNKTLLPINSGHLWVLDMASTLYEIEVPTISYRMGVRKMGCGAAVIGRNKMLHYTVLGFPQRFPQLKLYMAAALVIFLIYAGPHIVNFLVLVCCTK